MPPTRGRRTTVRRAAASTSAAKPSIRLTVKAPPSKLRQALNSSDGDTPEPPVRNARSTRNPRIVIEPDTDEDTEEPEEPEEEVEGEDAAGDEDDEEGVEEDEDDAGGDEEEDEEEEDEEEDEEDDDDDEEDDEGDISMAGHPPPPIIKTTGKAQQSGRGRAKIGITVSAPTGGALKSVEDKELEMDDDDLSDLGSEDPLGEDDEGEEDDDLSDTDMEGGSGSATPNLDKLTRRQRAAYQQQLEGGLMALSNEATKKKELTAEEHAMRRAEMARRRKNLSEKRNEEEKMDTINKLLKKPAPKRRSRAEIIAAANAAGTPDVDENNEYTADPLYTRWVSSLSGSRLGVPIEWLEGAAGPSLAQGWTRPPERTLVEEIS